jgi:hypothetical protein
MLASIGLYSYAFISTRWNFINNDLISKHNLTNKEREYMQLDNNKTIQLKYRIVRHAFRSHYGLFGYCLDYKWLNLLTIKSQNKSQLNSTLTSSPCHLPLIMCPETGLCVCLNLINSLIFSFIQVKGCDHIVDCPSHIDEEVCSRSYDQTRYYWKEEKCIWHSLSLDIQGIPRWLLSCLQSSGAYYDMKIIRYYIMLILFLAAPLLTFLALLILSCLNCIDRFYSIPFAFVSWFSLTSFLCGASGLGIFLYEWINERLYQLDYTTELGQIEPSISALNPWIINVECFGLAFWIIISAIGINLFTTILSCCFFCGLQSDKSKLRIYINNDKYSIVHTSLYD